MLEGDASIVFHYANAWEEGSRIKVAACAFDRYELGAEYGFDAAGGRFDPSLLLRHDNAWGPFLRLSTVDLAAGTVTHETVEHVHRDFPRVHPRREGRPTKYAYVAASPELGDGEPRATESHRWRAESVSTGSRAGSSPSSAFRKWRWTALGAP